MVIVGRDLPRDSILARRRSRSPRGRSRTGDRRSRPRKDHAPLRRRQTTRRLGGRAGERRFVRIRPRLRDRRDAGARPERRALASPGAESGADRQRHHGRPPAPRRRGRARCPRVHHRRRCAVGRRGVCAGAAFRRSATRRPAVPLHRRDPAGSAGAPPSSTASPLRCRTRPGSISRRSPSTTRRSSPVTSSGMRSHDAPRPGSPRRPRARPSC